MAGAGGVSMEKFEEYFQRADLDRDGRISGAEAVSFLQGSNVPRQVLAQVNFILHLLAYFDWFAAFFFSMSVISPSMLWDPFNLSSLSFCVGF